MTRGAEVIDFNAEWLHRKILYHMNANEWDEAVTISALLEGYLDGQIGIEFLRGEPLFSVKAEPTKGLDEGASV